MDSFLQPISESPATFDTYTQIVSRYMKIDNITAGDTKQNYLMRYRGRLIGEPAETYDQVAARLRPYGITPLFRKDKEQHAILLVQGIINPKPSNPWTNLVLFILTVFSVIFAGTLFTYTGPLPDDILGMVRTILENLRIGLPFAISLLAILLAHEFGHFLAGRYHKAHVTLPYFIPFPLSPFGTMGAFIQLKEPPKNKRVLLDIGLAGPIAGLVVAIPILLFGLSLSHVAPIQIAPGQAFQIEGNSLFYLLSKFLIFRQWLPTPSSFDGLPPLLYWVRYFFTGQPLPIGGLDVMIHPIAWAGWAGLLVTALNLIPAGQLDGGHLLYTLLGKRAQVLWPIVLGALVLLGIAWHGWWLWALLILIMGRLYAEPLDQITQLDRSRAVMAVLGLVIFILVFTPVPLIQFLANT
jgi:membrane-associated protease RseP (regulator of RpoE activity)